MIKTHITSLLANWPSLGLVKCKNYLLSGLLSILLSSQLFSQTIENIPLPGTFEMQEYYPMQVFNNELYFSASDGSNGVYGALFKYDETSVTQITLPEDLEIADYHPMIVYDGDLYMVLEDGSMGIYGALYKYDGFNFTSVSLTIFGEGESTIDLQVLSETYMVVYDDKLYMVLEGTTDELFYYDGVDITAVSLPTNYEIATPSEMIVYNSNLYVVLEDGSNGIYGALYEYNGSSFSEISMPETYSIDSDGSPLVVYKDALYFAIGDGFVGIRGLLHKYDGITVTQALPTNLEVQEEYGMEVYAGQIYMVLEDNGSSAEFYMFNGTSATKVGLPSNYQIEYNFDMEVYNNQLFAIFSDTDNSIYGGFYAYTASLDSKPPLETGNCGRNILEFESSTYGHVGTITDFSYASGTFEAWVKKNDWTEGFDDALFSNGIGFPFENSFYISFHPGVGLHFRYGGQSESGNLAAYVSTVSTDTLADGSWHHIAATWYNNGGSTQLVTYIDGIEIANQTSSENILLTGIPEFGIGEGVVNYLYDFEGGAMSEIRLWDVARSQEEIEADMNLLLTGSESGLIAYWPFDDAQGSTTAANLVQPGEVATLMDFTDIENAWVNYPLEIRADGNIILKDGAYDFGSVGVDGSAEITFTIINNGFYEIELTDSPITFLSGTNADQFSLDLSGTESTLVAGASTTFTISFEPTSLNEKIASFSISNFEICSDAYEINIAGTGLNDDCTSARELTVSARGEGDYTDGNTEDANNYEGILSCTETPAKDVWYSFTTSSTGAVEINTALGTAASLSGAVYLGCEASSIFCVVDLPSKIYLPVAPNTEIYIQLWTSTEDAGTFSVRINELPNAWTFSGWSAGEAPGTTDDALILFPYSTTDEGSLEVNDLELYADGELYGGGLEIGNADYVIVNGDLTNEGGVFVQSGGSLVTKGNVTTVDFATIGESTVGMIFERNTTFNETTGRYSIVGSPIQDANFSDLGSSALIYAYDESELYNASGNVGADRFKTPTQLGLRGIEPGEGYFSAFTGDENGTVTFIGTPNFGSIDVDLSYTDHSTNSGDLTENDAEGFNLISNPYPAAISASAFLAANSTVDMDQSIYIWDDFGSDTERGTNADYIVVNEFGNTLTNSRNDGEERFDGNIRSVQGFFVKANSASQTLQFTDAMKVSGNNSDGGYFRKGDVSTYKLIVSNEKSKKALIVGFTDDATLGKDKAYDALTFSGGDLQFHSILVGGTSTLAIQGLPTSYSGEIALGFSSTTGEMHTIQLSDEDKTNESIWLTDKQVGTTIDLTTQSYSFMSKGEHDSDRFILSRASEVLGLENSKTAIYAVNKTLHIKPETSILTTYEIFNLQGAKVINVTLNGSSKVDLSFLPNGVYLVSDGLKATKIILK